MKRFKNILLVCDRDGFHDGLLARAVRLAESNGARITVVDPVEPESGDISVALASLSGTRARDIEREILDMHRARLADIAASIGNRGIAVRSLVLPGIPFVEIIRLVLRDGHDLVMKGAGGRAAGLPLLFAGTDLHLLRKCPCPVWIMKPEAGETYARVLAAVDPAGGRKKATLDRLILDLASSQAAIDGGELHVVHTWRFASEESLRHSPFLRTSAREVDRILVEEEARHRKLLDALLEGHPAAEPAERVHLLKGDARSRIPAFAREIGAELIVMGTVGRTGVSGLFIGNTAESILAQVDCSVLAVKPPGFRSPVALED